jgi:hypothetical protein
MVVKIMESCAWGFGHVVKLGVESGVFFGVIFGVDFKFNIALIIYITIQNRHKKRSNESKIVGGNCSKIDIYTKV